MTSSEIRLLAAIDCTGIQLHNAGFQHPDPHHSFGPIVRTEYILQYITAGKGILKILDKTYPLSAGDLFLLPPGVLLYYAADSENPYSYYWTGFGGPNAPEFLERAGFPKDRYVRQVADSEVEECMRRMYAAAGGETERERLLAVSEFYRLFSLLVSDRPGRERSQNEIVSRALSFLHRHYAEDVKISKLCEDIGIDRTYFSVIFKRACGMSPAEYLINYRLSQACRLFSSQKSITEIAMLCGFPDAANFSVRFRKYTGYTPRDYRKLMSLGGNEPERP